MPDFRLRQHLDSAIIEMCSILSHSLLMSFKNQQQTYYRALLDKNPEYDGLFYVGVKTTGVFCRSTCPARKPKFENCEFFENAKQAMHAAYRPCKRCKPLSHPQEVSDVVRKLLEAIEHDPEKRWKEQDFRNLSIDSSTARRQFKKRFGMTFVEYARARRMGLALQEIKSGSSVINSQHAAGYQSSSGFRDAFSRIMGDAPSRLDQHVLKAAWLDTKLGPMLAITDDKGLYLLEFVDRRGLESEVERLRQKTKSAIVPGQTLISKQISAELAAYFSGQSLQFNTPIQTLGTPFQKQVWEQLKLIPAGETRAYLDIAKAVKKPTSVRAVAQSNGANQLAIIIPCHRVIAANGDLTGYGGGLSRKQWLLDHEKRNKA